MSEFKKKEHWENIYTTKELKDVSWYQPKPETSLEYLEEMNIPKSAKIIDIGGGDSLFVDYLLEMGYENITVLDISESALEKAKNRIGEGAKKVTWIVCDAALFQPQTSYDFWHDRAAFHFLTTNYEIENYIKSASYGISQDGKMLIGTFSENGPKKCSGIEIKPYSETTMAQRFSTYFQKVKCLQVDHTTPSGSTQNFTFCSFKKKNLVN